MADHGVLADRPPGLYMWMRINSQEMQSHSSLI